MNYLTPFCLQDIIEVDAETKEMLKMMGFQSIPGLQMTTAGKQNFPWSERIPFLWYYLVSSGRGGGNPNYQGNRN